MSHSSSFFVRLRRCDCLNMVMWLAEAYAIKLILNIVQLEVTARHVPNFSSFNVLHIQR